MAHGIGYYHHMSNYTAIAQIGLEGRPRFRGAGSCVNFVRT